LVGQGQSLDRPETFTAFHQFGESGQTMRNSTLVHVRRAPSEKWYEVSPLGGTFPDDDYLLMPWVYGPLDALVSLKTDPHSFPLFTCCLYRFSFGSRKSVSSSFSDVNLVLPTFFSIFLLTLTFF
jgi:hypothetical protein